MLKARFNGNDTLASIDILPLEERDINFYVTLLFGHLKIGEGWFMNGKSLNV